MTRVVVPVDVSSRIIVSGMGKYGSGDAVVIVPRRLVPAFCEVIRRGMAYEHGQPREMYEFVDELSAKNDPTRPGHGGSDSNP